jgi:Xaa-Pro aminopeptidase
LSYGTLAVDYEKRVDFDKLRKDRLNKSLKQLELSEVDALFCLDPDNIRYITSATIGTWARDKMTRYVILPRGGEPILFDVGSRVVVQKSSHGAPWLKGNVQPAVAWGRGAVPAEVGAVKKVAGIVKQVLRDHGIGKGKVGVDILDVPLFNAFKDVNIEVVDGNKIMLESRLIKSPEEIDLLDTAAMMADCTYYELAKNVRPGVRENDLVGIANNLLYSMGSDFVECINCISGPRTNPHHHDFTDRRLRPGDIVFFDIMHSFCGYRTCYYRTFSVGNPSQEKKDLYDDCLSWLQESIKVVKPGATTKDIADKWPGPEVLGFSTENEVLANQWGHGIGMSIWEPPVISRAWSLKYPYPIKKDMVMALETYAGEKNMDFGIRIEEEVVVTSNGHKVLTRFPVEELISCPL